MHSNSIQFKATLLYSGILLLILLVYNAALFLAVKRILVRDIDEKLQIKAGEIADIIKTYEEMDKINSKPHNILENMMNMEGSRPEDRLVIDDLWRMEFKTLNLYKDYISIYDKEGHLLFRSRNIKDTLIPKFKEKMLEGTSGYDTMVIKGSSLRMIHYKMLYKNRLNLVIQVATPLSFVKSFLSRIGMYILISTFIILIITSFVGSTFARRILQPIAAVIKTADNISHEDMSARIIPREMDSEMQQLVSSFNSMIERLDQSFRYINEFSSNVAHELKTPLAIVRGELELAIDQLPEGNENRGIMEECLEEIDRTIRIIKDLLFMAMVEHQPKILEFKKIDISGFLKEIHEHAAILASEKEVDVDLKLPSKDLYVSGDRVHLRRLFFNIITNAIKYTPSKGKITIEASKKSSFLNVAVSDTGEGISRNNLEKIFDKFYRVDKKDSTSESGSGLGLSIALSIARAHQGNIEVDSRVGEGTVFTVTIPLIKN